MKLFSKKILPQKFFSLKNINYNFNPILHNRIVLYFIFILAFFNMIYFLITNDISSFIVLILVGFLTSFFSKNMIVILVIALAISHISKYGVSSYNIEGMETIEKTNDNIINDIISDKKNDIINENVDNSKNKKNTSKLDNDPMDGKKKIEYSDIKKEYNEFQKIQDTITKNLSDLEPSLQKAEDFIKKFESYKEGLGKK
jgi:hypothetical protein